MQVAVIEVPGLLWLPTVPSVLILGQSCFKVTLQILRRLSRSTMVHTGPFIITIAEQSLFVSAPDFFGSNQNIMSGTLSTCRLPWSQGHWQISTVELQVVSSQAPGAQARGAVLYLQCNRTSVVGLISINFQGFRKQRSTGSADSVE